MNMTESDAKKEIEHNVFCNTDDFEMKISKECYKTIINALEKQIAKKLVVWDNGTQHCPNCEHDLTYISSEDEYCCRCGQKFLREVE